MAMTPRERWLACLNGKKPDRVPLDYWATGEFNERLLKELGLPDMGAFFAKFGIDHPAHVGPRYVGPPIEPAEDVWGWRTSPIQYGSGTYDEISFSPLAPARTPEDIERHRWPRADWWDFSNVAADCARHPDRIIESGYVAALMYHNHLRGLELSYEDYVESPEIAESILKRIFDFYYEYLARLLDSAKGRIQLTQVTDDFGTQTGMAISPAAFRRFFKEPMRKLINLAHGAGAYVMHHDDGAIRPIIPDLIEIGVDILNPIQWRCPGMERQALARDFGRKLVFHGGVDNQRTLPFGKPEDVRREVEENVSIFGKAKGYVLAPCHNIQAITPPENVVTMYETALKARV